MKYYNDKVIITLVIILLALNIFSEISKQPDLTVFSGKVKVMSDETYLITGEDFFQLDIAPESFLKEKGVVISNKSDLQVKGVLNEEIIVVYSIIQGEETIDIRNSVGKPEWETDIRDKEYYIVDSDKCIGCRLCVSKCPTNAITMVKGVAVIDTDKCIACGICANGDNNRFKGCPVKAISKAE